MNRDEKSFFKLQECFFYFNSGCFSLLPICIFQTLHWKILFVLILFKVSETVKKSQGHSMLGLAHGKMYKRYHV